VNGDEVRRAWFLDFMEGEGGPGGYDAADVYDLLARVAAELDSGRPVRPLIANATFQVPSKWSFLKRRGLLTGAVDWFLEQLLLQENPSEMARTNTDPWRDLATEPYCVYREPGELAGLVAAPPQQEYADAWRDFGWQPGTRLSWVQAGAHCYELRAAGQQTLATSKGRRSPTLSLDGRIFTWYPAQPMFLRNIAETIGRDRPGAPSRMLGADIKAIELDALIDEKQRPVLYKGGRHFHYYAGAYVKFPGHQGLRFPVRATGVADAVMTAVDQAGNKVARYRVAPDDNNAWTVQISVHPDRQLTDELTLAIAVSAPFLRSYFIPPTGGQNAGG
jgi:hypothetical protein